MSIATEIERIKTAKTAMRDAINAKGGNLTASQRLDEYAAEVTALPSGGSVDLSFITASASDILYGKVSVSADGTRVIGTIEDSIPAVVEGSDDVYISVPPGYLTDGIELTIDKTKPATDLSFITATASDILSGKIGVDKDGNQVNGTIQTVTATLSGNIVTVPAGHIAQEQILTVTEMAEPSVSANVVTIPVGYNKTQKTKTVAEAGQTTVSGNVVTTPVGYVKTERKTTVGTAKGAETITPGTADKTIASGTYLTGALTFKGDANWTEENIAEGVSMWGKIGTYKGGTSGMDFYKCAAVYGPRQAICVTVSGCPNTTVNGNYLPTEFTVEDWEGNKYPVYSNGTYYYYFNGVDNQWCIGTDYNSHICLYLSWGTDMASTSWNDPNCEPVDGMSSAESEVTVDTDVPKTWDGYKAVLNSGIYNFESELTTGMTYTSMKPEILKVYSADASIRLASFPCDYPIDKLVFHAPLCDDVTATEVGGTLKNRNVTVETVGGIQAARFVPTATLNTTAPLPIDCKDGSGEFSVFFCINPSAVIHEAIPLFIGYAGNSNTFAVETRTDGGSMFLQFLTENVRVPFAVDTWYTFTAVRRGTTYYVYNGKTLFGSTSYNGSLDNPQLVLGARDINDSRYNFNGYMRNILIYNRALSEAEIAQLNDKFAIGADNESGDGGDSGQGDGNAYVYTVSGAGDADANGNYYDSGMTDPAGHHIYTNDKCTLCLWIESSDSSGYRWIITRSADEQELYSSYTTGEPTISSHTWGVVFGAEPAPTVTEY